VVLAASMIQEDEYVSHSEGTQGLAAVYRGPHPR
jgi:hypothetical protein